MTGSCRYSKMKYSIKLTGDKVTISTARSPETILLSEGQMVHQASIPSTNNPKWYLYKGPVTISLETISAGADISIREYHATSFKNVPIASLSNLTGVSNYVTEFLRLEEQHKQYPAQKESKVEAIKQKNERLRVLENEEKAATEKYTTIQHTLSEVSAEENDADKLIDLFNNLDTIVIGEDTVHPTEL